VATGGLDVLNGQLRALTGRLETLPDRAVGKVGRAGNDVIYAEARRLWGADRKFSGAKRSRKARRAATVRYKLEGAAVVFYPSGDPWHITMKGRAGGKRIRPKPARRRATAGKGRGRAAVGGRMARAYSVTGRLRARPTLLEAVGPRLSAACTDALHDVYVHDLVEVFHR